MVLAWLCPADLGSLPVKEGVFEGGGNWTRGLAGESGNDGCSEVEALLSKMAAKSGCGRGVLVDVLCCCCPSSACRPVLVLEKFRAVMPMERRDESSWRDCS